MGSSYAEIDLKGSEYLGANYGTTITNLRSALQDSKGNPLTDGDDGTGNVITLATATGDVLKHAVNLGDLQNAYNLDAHVDASNIGKNLKGSDGKTAATTDEQNTNENAWGTAIGTGEVANPTEVKDSTGKVTNDPTTNGSQQLVTGGTVYKALNGGMTKIVIGTPGKDGKDGADGKPGTIGLVGPAGTNGKDGAVDITIQKGEDGKDGSKGANGVDGKDGINRIVYEDKNGKHQTATMEDGMKFAGDDGQSNDAKVIAKKLNNTIDIIGGADSTKLTENNIGVNNVDGKLKVQLAQELTGITSISGSTDTNGAKITLDEKDKNISVNGGSIKAVATNLDENGKIIQGNENNAANMSDVSKLINNAADSNGKKLADKANIDASNIGTNLKDSDGKTAATADEQITNENAWGTAIGTGEVANPTEVKDSTGKVTNDPTTNGSQQLVTGGTVYKALNGGMTKIVIGTPGKDGKDGADGKPGTIGLVGPAGTNGKDGAVDITIQKGEDGKDGSKGANGVDGKDGINRIVYEDKNGKHQAATMEDGLKFAGDDGKEIAKKLNNTLEIVGGADNSKLTDKNIGVNNVDGKLKIQLAQDLTGITSISGSTDDNGAKITLDTADKNISVNGGSIKAVASNLTKDANGKYTVNTNSDGNAANMGDVQNLVNQTVADAAYTPGDGIDITGKVISVKKGDGLKFNDNGELVVNTGNGLEMADGAVKIKAADSNLNVDSNGIGLSDKVTIGSDKTKQVTIDGTAGEVSGLTNKDWNKDNGSQYEQSGKAATEAQVQKAYDAAVKEAGTNAAKNDIHVAAGEQSVSKDNKISMNLVDGNGDTQGTVTIKDVARASDVGDISKLDKGVQNATGTTTVVDAINNVNTKIGDQQYYKGDDKGHTVKNGDSITSAIGKLDSAVQNAASEAGRHATVSADDTSNITVTPEKKTDGHINYKVDMKKDISVDSVTAKTVTADNAAIGGVTIKDQTISGLKDTDIKEGSTNAVNGNTIWKELRPDNDGSYIKKDSITAQNLKSLDTQVKKTADLINSDGKTIRIGGSDAATKVDVSDKDGNGRTITGVVTDGNDNSSAANVGYVNEVNAASTQQIYQDMHSAYGHLNNNINKAAAGSNALAALHPLDYDPADKASYAVGYGHYRNANAAAVGAFYQPNANTMVSVGVSMGNGDPGVNAGVSFKVGKGSAYNGMSKVEMAETIQNQAQKIDNLEKENQEMKKQIQEILAKLGK